MYTIQTFTILSQQTKGDIEIVKLNYIIFTNDLQ